MNQKLFGHLVFGFFFLLNGLWHLFNHIKLHSLNPNSYTFLPWFPTPISRHLELHLAVALSSLSLLMMLVRHPGGHQAPLLLSDGTVPSNRLIDLEHSCISLSLFAYAALATLLDLSRAPHPKARRGLTLLLSALTYLQGLLVVHFHSADHAGLEGRYHTLIQLILLACAATTLLGIGLPRSFPVGFARSLSVMLMGAWNIVMGTALWGGPTFMVKGCFLEQDHESGFMHVVTCSGDEALQRAKSLANLQFSWLLTGIAVFGVSLYLALVRVYGGQGNYNKEYFSPQIMFTKQGDHMEEEEDDDDDDDDDDEGNMLFGPMM